MIIDKSIEKRTILACFGAVFLFVQIMFWLLPSPFIAWDAQISDKLLEFRTRSHAFHPNYDDTIVYVDLNSSSKQILSDFHLDRSHHARVIRNLSRMGVALQLHDFIFAGKTTPESDRHLVNAICEAGNVHIGMAFQLEPRGYALASGQGIKNPEVIQEKTRRRVSGTKHGANYYSGHSPIVPYPELAKHCADMGYLNLFSDSDGVFRRLPLLLRAGDQFAMSFSLAAVCDYLNVPNNQVMLRPGAIVLQNARLPREKKTSDIAIPVDRNGAMRINFIGAWGRMKHYNWADVFLASEDMDEMELWADELSGKIVLVSDTSTGFSDVGQVPTDAAFPLSGVHANSIHTILSQSFIREISNLKIIAVELAFIGILVMLAIHQSAVIYSLTTLVMGGLYLIAAALMALYANILIPVSKPLLVILMGMVSVQIVSALYNARTHARNEKAREVAEKELEIGRQIQAGFMPEVLPSFECWEFAAQFKPARQVAGDFYDLFSLNDNKLIGAVIADVCDKGVGAALFMALISSLMRSSAEREIAAQDCDTGSEDSGVRKALMNTIQQTSDYIAIKHEDSGMFATVFFGILNPVSGSFKYINCGHEPPALILKDNSKMHLLKPTGPALGLMPELNFQVNQVQINAGDILFAFTDGVTDALNAHEEAFSRERLLQFATQNCKSAHTLLKAVMSALSLHTDGTPQFDDITMIAIRNQDKH